MARPRLTAFAMALVFAAGNAVAEVPAPFNAADPAAPAVTAKSLLASERFWPYQVELVRPWTSAPDRSPFRKGTLGVLVRVEDQHRLRLDFGSEGRFSVPIETTDVVRRANEIRTGTSSKRAPNLARAIGTRLVDSESEQIRYYDPERVTRAAGFLAVLVDPRTQALDEIANALAPLQGRHGVSTVLFPQAEIPDEEVRSKLRSLGWRVPFALDAYAEGLASSLAVDGAVAPAVMLLSREGAVVLGRPWEDGIEAELATTIERVFGEAGSGAAAGSDARKANARVATGSTTASGEGERGW